jgi:hypothetical protein
MALVVVQTKSIGLPNEIEVDDEEKLLITGLKIDGISDGELPPPPPQETIMNKEIVKIIFLYISYY